MTPITACLEVCAGHVCRILGCSSAGMIQSNETVISAVNDTTMNATQLPCQKQVVVRINEVPFAVCLVIIFILSAVFTIYAIAKKRLSRNGVLQTRSTK